MTRRHPHPLPTSTLPGQRPLRIAPTAVMLAVTTLAGPALAQTETLRVEVTGSIIRRSVSDETALPVTSLKAEDLTLRGHTELKDFMLELPQANSLGSFAGTAGPITSLRGLGPMRTLTLLDGRRLAKEPLTNQYVSLSVIPRMALERVDILRDGASSAYGSDAIGGVQAFYTMRAFEGLKVRAELLEPERSGGGDEQTLGLAFGRGNLAKDGWNAYAALEVQKRKVLKREERPELIDGSALNSLGISTAPALGANATPGNFTDPTHPTSSQRTLRYNPYYGAACLDGHSVPSTAGGRQTCFQDPDTYTAFSNGNDNLTLFAKGTLALGADHRLSLEYNLAKFTVKQYNAPVPVTVRLESTHPYYPGKGLVPAVPGVDTGDRPIDVLWSVDDLGHRVREDKHTNQRIVLAAEGRFGQWDYRSGLNFGTSERDTGAGSGWTTVTGIASTQGTARTLYLDPRLNPFGLQTQQGLDLLNANSVEGRSFRLHKAGNTSLDFTLTRDLMDMAGGPLTLAVGGEFRRDSWHAVGLAINDPAPSLNGLVDLLGQDAQAVGASAKTENKINRNITSAFAELDVPVLKTLTLNASVRADKYDDLHETTVNPKLSARWQPMRQLVLRASANTGYRAPSIPEIYTKETELTSIPTFDDPTLCPTINGVKTPRAGYTFAEVCSLTNRFQITKDPSTTGVKPETSKSFTLGFGLEPVKGLTMTVDYWKTQMDDVIGTRPIDFILANPDIYSGIIRRNADGTLALNAVFNAPSNVGSVRAAGLDVSVKFVSQPSSAGIFSAGIDIAYLTRWDARSEGVNGDNWMTALGYYNDVVPVNPNAGLSNATRGFNNRWRHTASVGWALGSWKAQLSQRYQSKFRDQNAAARTGTGTEGPRNVAAYEQYNLGIEYSGIKNLKLGLAVNNLFDRQPPLTNHTGYNGYLTSSVDVLGRAYRLSAEYTF
ncbi:TonB-dependent receptor domain-containing protein [Aquabacterium sp.]|uniref:TonB-dependent receptor domain-containing protein n=1 Tax=Aquabacterium sp. TaxID=1872578 RepID=UPI002BCDDE60|nr:TonB-dependent receptor [Aquabacterium sp.]HSW07449.1 TonB-dependent receptor [Aquabacterium sp.]